MESKCSLQIVNNGKKLYGTAAQLHKISSEGGWDRYHEKMVERITRKVTHEVLEEMNRPTLRRIK